MEPNTENIADPSVEVPRLVRLGDYVLASKYSDRDPGDPWRVGYVVRIIDWWRPHPKLPTKIEKRYIIGEADGTWSDFREYAHCLHITPEEGKAWLEANI